uniref:Uncharacterized protein n=1 Tax=Arundo donax TaxID=35708 RepID=A0A0A9BZK6_ARUDO
MINVEICLTCQKKFLYIKSTANVSLYPPGKCKNASNISNILKKIIIMPS